jgi:flagellar biosynthesis/type III secretory pathway M-ring protein FliF/YscJ
LGPGNPPPPVTAAAQVDFKEIDTNSDGKIDEKEIETHNKIQKAKSYQPDTITPMITFMWLLVAIVIVCLGTFLCTRFLTRPEEEEKKCCTLTGKEHESPDDKTTEDERIVLND